MDKHGFKLFFDAHYDAIRNYIYYKTGDVDLADDLTQTVFLKFWEKRDSVIDDTAKSYLYKIATNLVFNHFKGSKNKLVFDITEEEADTSDNPQQALEADEFMGKLQEGINRLSEAQREAFLMNRIDQLTYKEIAQRLAISEKAVEKRMHQAIKWLKEYIGRKL